jgi:hypothetical protein
MTDRRVSKDRIVILADVSPSMAEGDGGVREGPGVRDAFGQLIHGGGKTRFSLLVEALSRLPREVLIITFSGSAREVRSAAEVQLDSGTGGTALHLGIEAAARHSPVRTIIISDGEPDSEPLARAAVEKLTGIVDVIYCGNPGNIAAKSFLASLARAGAGGFYQTGDQVDVAKQLPAVIAGLLKA